MMLGILFLAPQTPRPTPCDSPEYHQFDFWIGDWEVVAPNGIVAGRSHVERIANGCGIEEQWTGSAGGSGRSLNHYGADHRWHQYWVGAGGSILNLSGTLDGNVMTLTDTTNRLMFTNRLDGSVRQQWQTTADNGKTWTTTFDGLYSRTHAAAGKPQGVTLNTSRLERSRWRGGRYARNTTSVMAWTTGNVRTQG
jgi:hypothetical protein